MSHFLISSKDLLCDLILRPFDSSEVSAKVCLAIPSVFSLEYTFLTVTLLILLSFKKKMFIYPGE